MKKEVLQNTIVKSRAHNMPVSARRVKLVADLIRGKKAVYAENLLKFDNRKASIKILPLLQSAVASAKELKSIEKEELYVSGILVGQGVYLKNRGIFGARGRFKPMKKRTTNLTLYLSKVDSLNGDK